MFNILVAFVSFNLCLLYLRSSYIYVDCLRNYSSNNMVMIPFSFIMMRL